MCVFSTIYLKLNSEFTTYGHTDIYVSVVYRELCIFIAPTGLVSVRTLPDIIIIQTLASKESLFLGMHIKVYDLLLNGSGEK